MKRVWMNFVFSQNVSVTHVQLVIIQHTESTNHRFYQNRSDNRNTKTAR